MEIKIILIKKDHLEKLPVTMINMGGQRPKVSGNWLLTGSYICSAVTVTIILTCCWLTLTDPTFALCLPSGYYEIYTALTIGQPGIILEIEGSFRKIKKGTFSLQKC